MHAVLRTRYLGFQDEAQIDKWILNNANSSQVMRSAPCVCVRDCVSGMCVWRHVSSWLLRPLLVQNVRDAIVAGSNA